MVTESGSVESQGLPVAAELGEGAGCIPIVSTPKMEKVGVFFGEESDEGQKEEAAEDHCEGAALGDADFAAQGLELIFEGVDDEEGVKTIAVEGEAGSGGPFVAGHPEHGSAVAFVEGVAGIHLKEAKVWVFGVVVPVFSCSVDAAFNAGLGAKAELVSGAGGGGFGTSD